MKRKSIVNPDSLHGLMCRFVLLTLHAVSSLRYPQGVTQQLRKSSSDLASE